MIQPAIDLKVVRAVKDLSPGTMNEILKDEAEAPYLEALDEDGVYLVDNDAPRDGPYTEEIMERTLGFALVDSMGRVHKKFKNLPDAERALAGATINFDVSVNVEEGEENDGARED